MNHSQEKAMKMTQKLELVHMNFKVATTLMIKVVKEHTLSLACGLSLVLSWGVCVVFLIESLA